MTFNAARLVAGRHSASLTQVQFALMIGVSVSALRRYESGKFEPSGSVLALMAQVTDHPMSWFIEGAEGDAPTTEEAEFLAALRAASPDTRMLLREQLRDTLVVARACASS